MSMRSELGKAFELVRALEQALEDAGGSERDISRIRAQKGLADEIAELVIQREWKVLDRGAFRAVEKDVKPALGKLIIPEEILTYVFEDEILPCNRVSRSLLNRWLMRSPERHYLVLEAQHSWPSVWDASRSLSMEAVCYRP